MANPTKSVWAFARAAEPAGADAEVTASFHWGEPVPNTFVTSPVAPVPVFSRTMLAAAIAPTSQPTRV